MVTATVVAPLRWASASASMVSWVAPEWEIATATSPGVSSAALVSAMCGSVQANATRPMRCSFCWKSSATKPLAPTP